MATAKTVKKKKSKKTGLQENYSLRKKRLGQYQKKRGKGNILLFQAIYGVHEQQ